MNNIDIISHLGLDSDVKKPANINNTNNTNNTNDTNNFLTTTTLVWSKDQSKEKENMTSSPLGKASPLETSSQEKEPLDSSQKISHKKMPSEWRGVKLDLYNNGINKDGSAKMKLNIGVIKKIDGSQVPLQASLNSSWDDGVRRSVDKNDWNNDPHWIKVKQHRKELEYLYDIRASKIGLKQKSGGTELVAFVFQDCSKTWCVDIISECQVYSYELTDELSESQIAQGHMIATVYAGLKKQRLLTAKELFS